MARFTEASKEAVIDSIDALVVVEDHLRLEKKSGRYWGLCPFHHEKTPSFTVDPEKKSYYCFGCHKGGSIVSFVMEMDKLSFPEAMEVMSKRFGVPLYYENGGIPQKKEGKIDELSELYRRVAASFHHILLNTNEGKKSKEYLLNRGIDLSIIEKFNLGFAPADRSWLYRFLSEKRFSADFLASSGLFSRRYPQSAFFSNRLIFPIADKNGRNIAFGGRSLETEGPKYINSPDSDLFKKGRTLFALDLALSEIKRTKEVYLAEGYMDVIALHQGGITNTIAPLGTAFTDEQAKILKRWAEKVYLMLDNDEAGQNAAQKAILCCRRNGLDCAIIDTFSFFKEKKEIPKDPAEILQKFGPEALKNSVKKCILDVDFMIFRSRALKESSQAVAFLFPYLDALDSEVARDSVIGTIADAFRVERRAVWEDYKRKKTTGSGRTAISAMEQVEKQTTEKPVRAGYELLLLGAVFVNPGLFSELRSGFSPEDFEESTARELYIILEEWFRETTASGEQDHFKWYGSSSELLDRLQDGNLRDFILRQEALGSFANPAKLLEDGMLRMKIKILEKKRRELIRELRNISHGDSLHNQEPQQADLLAEKVYIDAELTRLKSLGANAGYGSVKANTQRAGNK
ncbi:MAG: DNA primase [Treponema sp.]|nr:DNA primase [Treponema sp.]